MDDPLLVTDAQAAKRVGVSADTFRRAAAALDREGFPQPDPLFGGRRYRPSVRAFLDRRYGIGEPQVAPRESRGDDIAKENWT